MTGEGMKHIMMIMAVLLFAQSAMAERLAVKAQVGNVRSGPGQKYEVLWNVEQNHPIEIIEKKGEWCRFRDFEGDQGWIHQDIVGKIDAVITVQEKCNIRSGPGTDFEVVFSVEKGIPFKVSDRKGDWLRVEHADGDKGWIHRSLVW